VLKKLGGVIGESLAKGGILHTFGSGHSEVISREIIGRPAGWCASAASPTRPAALWKKRKKKEKRKKEE